MSSHNKKTPVSDMDNTRCFYDVSSGRKRKFWFIVGEDDAEIVDLLISLSAQ